MAWLNGYGLGFMIVIMIPNIVFAMKCKEGFVNLWKNKTVEMFEQIGRFGSFGLMAINIPGLSWGFTTPQTLRVYLIVDGMLVALYCFIWVICFKKNSIFRALALSIIPSIIFVFSGTISRNIPLLIAAIIFAPSHIMLSYKNAILALRK